MTTTMGALSRRVVGNSPRNDSNSNDNNKEKTLATTTGNVEDDSKYHHKKRGPWRRILATMIVLLPLALILPVTIDFDESIGYNKDYYEESAQHMMTKHTFSYLDPWTNESVTRTVLVDPPARFHRRPLNYYNDDSDSHHELMDFRDMDLGSAFPLPPRDSLRQCVPMGDWQTANYQTCNKLHEQRGMDILTAADDGSQTMEFINCGESRCTFVVHEQQRRLVLKTLKVPGARFSSSQYKKAVKDSIALERLSSSPYVVNLYASCAVSQIVEYSSGGNIHDLLKRSRQQEKVGASRHHQPAQYQRHQLTTPLDKLKIAFQIVTAVADMHSLEDHPDGLPSMVHNDLCCHQFLLVDGIYKLGDFDWATFLTQTTNHHHRKQQQQHELCQTTPLRQYHTWIKALSPEELPYYSDFWKAAKRKRALPEKPPTTRVLRDKLDIYQIGNVCYTIFTNWWIWEGYTRNSAILKAYQVRLLTEKDCCCATFGNSWDRRYSPNDSHCFPPTAFGVVVPVVAGRTSRIP